MNNIKQEAGATMQAISSTGYTSGEAAPVQTTVSLKIVKGEIDGARYYNDGDVIVDASIESAQALVEKGVAKVITTEEAQKIIAKQQKVITDAQAALAAKELRAKPLTEWTNEELIAGHEKQAAKITSLELEETAAAAAKKDAAKVVDKAPADVAKTTSSVEVKKIGTPPTLGKGTGK